MNHTRLLVRASPTRLSTSGQQSYKGWSSRVGAPSVNFTFPWKAWRLTLWAKPTISSITTLCSNSSEFRRFCFTGVAHPITRTLIVCRFPSNDISRVYLRCLDKLEMWDTHNITINISLYAAKTLRDTVPKMCWTQFFRSSSLGTFKINSIVSSNWK